MCFCFAVFVDDWCLTCMRCYVVIGYVMFVCVFVLPLFVDDWCLNFGVILFCEGLCKVGVCLCFAIVVDDLCLNLMFCYVGIGCVKLVCVFVQPCC